MPKIFSFWSGPRNVSTALMYSFAQRADTRVLDEPLFGHFLKKTGVWRPSREEVLQTMKTDARQIFKSFSNVESPFLMLKNMANHLEGLPKEILFDFKNVILTRHPQKVLASYTKKIEAPTTLDLGYFHQLKIIEFLKDKERDFLVVDSDSICEKPETELQNICVFLEIPFDEKMLSWQAGARNEDGVWAKYWYGNVHRSTGFSKPSEKDYSIPKSLENLYKESLEIYQKINQIQ